MIQVKILSSNVLRKKVDKKLIHQLDSSNLKTVI